jgi:hypothetical protein
MDFWKINPIPNPSSRWAYTALSGTATAADTHIDVTGGTGSKFAANDEITIAGYDSSSPAVDAGGALTKVAVADIGTGTTLIVNISAERFEQLTPLLT